MANLLHGPRLGNPSSGGFVVWLRFDGAATVSLSVRKHGALSYNVVDTQAVDTALSNTVVLTATGLEPQTKYDYRVTEGATTHAEYWTTTMPPDAGGQFVMFSASDLHGYVLVGNALATMYNDWVTNYDPISMPCVFVLFSDLWVTGSTGKTADEYLTDGATSWPGPTLTTLDTVGICKYVPTCYMWDDWDYGGNNSCREAAQNYSTLSGPLTMWSYVWRYHPQPAPPSKGYLFSVAGVPFIVVDPRSQKAATPGSIVAAPYYNWEGPSTLANQAWGAAQTAWLKETLRQASAKGLVVMVHGNTFRDNVNPARSPWMTGGKRDSVGIYHRAERNELLTTLLTTDIAWKNNLVLITGDDHWNGVWKGLAGGNAATGDPKFPDFPNSHPASIGIPFLEFKTGTITAPTTNAGNSPVLFGPGDWFSYYLKGKGTGATPGCAAYQRWIITSSQNGEHVTARMTYVVAYRVGENLTDNPTDTTVAGDTMLDDNAIPGDFYYRDGYFAYWDPTSTAQTPAYPPENGPGKVTFRESYMDDILGTMHKREDTTRNPTGELRRADDFEDIDRDDILESWCIPTEGVTENEP